MPKALDLIGQKFGRLTAIQRAENQGRKTYWLCECECGNKKEVQTSHLIRGSVQSCGCLRKKNKTPGQKVIDFRSRIKIALVEANNHRCAICDLVDDPVVYDFHHLEPENKEFAIGSSTTTRSKQAYADEAKKCVMLCSNCHRKVEKGLLSQEGLRVIFNEEKYFETLKKMTN